MQQAFVLKNLILHISIFQLGIAWKPIVGQPAYTSSFSFQQEHPSVVPPKDIGIDSKGLFEAAGDAAATGFKDFFPNTIHDEDSLKIVKPLQEVKLTNNFEYDFVSGQFLTKYESEKLGNKCSAKKFAFNQDGVVYYDSDMPALEQFTICFWTRYTNHSGDHVLLTYSAENDPRAIQFWVANSKNSSFISMAIKGQQMYRLNYPLRTRQWHHTCSSWNGKTGEWQIWLKAERIGRGFHNSLVNHKIPAKGHLYSGGSSVTGNITDGLHFEISFVQVYKVALSAGKAHRDHKHHHAHHFDHEGQELVSTTKAPPKINKPQLMHSLLANGQIPSSVRINLATQESPAAVAGPLLTIDGSSFPRNDGLFGAKTNIINGQINTGSRLVAQQLLGLNAAPQQIQSKTTIRTQQLDLFGKADEPKFVDETETHIQFKRHAKQNLTEATSGGKAKSLEKRDIVLVTGGGVLKDSGFDTVSALFEGLTSFGTSPAKAEKSSGRSLDGEVEAHDREPAEGEVQAVMAICSACDPEPFPGAIVFAWHKVQEKMDNALKGLTMGSCGKF